MEKVTIDKLVYLIGYHTQEFRIDEKLISPEKCNALDAWLGFGYYFWADIEFAKYWGEDCKIKTGYYDIYKANLNFQNCLNTVFNEEQYFFFKNCLEKTINNFQNNGKIVSLNRVHEFLSDNFWESMGVTGIIYDDMPINPKNKPSRKYSVINHSDNSNNKFFYYKKRIQIVIFNLKNICNFDIYLEKQN